jgi:hypothetical protein
MLWVRLCPVGATPSLATANDLVLAPASMQAPLSASVLAR